MEPRLVEMWLRMLADGVRGAEDARRALEALGASSPDDASLIRWMEMWMPKASEPDRRSKAGVEEFQEMVAESWKSIGVVPRYEYLQLLERYEQLKQRLEEAEETVEHLRELLEARGTTEEAAKVLDSWDQMTKSALDAQAHWTRTWLDALGGGARDGKD